MILFTIKKKNEYLKIGPLLCKSCFLPKTHNINCILISFDRLSKYYEKSKKNVLN